MLFFIYWSQRYSTGVEMNCYELLYVNYLLSYLVEEKIWENILSSYKFWKYYNIFIEIDWNKITIDEFK